MINLPWDARLGATRVWMELTQEWRAAGHSVDHFSLSDAFPRPTRRNTVLSLRQLLFVPRAARFIRKNGAGYDVIDSLLGTIPFPKTKLRFDGLLVARSVGFFWLYEKFDRHARNRWPEIPRGKLAGRFFYSFTRRRGLRSARRAIDQADLVNLPNDDELRSLRQDLHSAQPAIVQPYGLSEERRRDLSQAARSPEQRLASPKVCFLGMWSVRKGARDLGEIVRRIRTAAPNVSFRFLGTFTDDAVVLRDLGIERCEGCEMIREYDPAALPTLLADCTAGIFPSYVEGFGLGLLEQLASGIPTVAYDAPGPRQILAPCRAEFLVLAGDVAEMSQRLAAILRSSPAQYAALSEKARMTAAQYSWRDIAANTIQIYREHLSKQRVMIFAQPFGWRSPGGGARILRALLRDPIYPVQLICTSTQHPPPQAEVSETHLPLRPHFGRLERSRFAGIAHATSSLFAQRFSRGLAQICGNASAVHAIAHGGLDFSHAFDVAEQRRIPFFLHVHDDFLYSAHVPNLVANRAMARAWSGAAARFVISDQLGREYQERYGSRDYTVITDGVDRIASAPQLRTDGRLRLYFMGLFHLEYESSLRTLIDSLRQLQRDGIAVSLTMRCGSLRRGNFAGAEFIRVLPFADETEIERDLADTDLLYLPLPFDAEHASFVRFSLSTKLVTYLGSGLPILYHGPAESAVDALLAQEQAAFLCHSLQPADLIAVLREFISNRDKADRIVAHALALARERFSLPRIRDKFWSIIREAVPA
ncbi:MAG: glycosyltransferase family 4 protein [Chthoniobacterales bacterium]